MASLDCAYYANAPCTPPPSDRPGPVWLEGPLTFTHALASIIGDATGLHRDVVGTLNGAKT